jgi:hypothetical protein
METTTTDKTKEAKSKTAFSFSLAALTSTNKKDNKAYCAADETLNYYKIRKRIRESGLI